MKRDMTLHENRARHVHMCQRPLARMRLLGHLPCDILSFIWKKDGEDELSSGVWYCCPLKR